MNKANLRQAFQVTASTLGIIVGLVSAGFIASFIASFIIDPGITWEGAASRVAVHVPALDGLAGYVAANQTLMTVLFYGILLLVVAGSLAFRRRDDRRLAAVPSQAGERMPGSVPHTWIP